MNPIRRLSVQHVRRHDNMIVALDRHVTLITGLNGSGKTSLLEAIYIALQGSSFKGSDSDVLRRDTSWWRIDVQYDDESVRTVKFDSNKTTGRKQFQVDGRTMYRLLPKYKYPVVLFEPDDLRLLNGSPARRRQFIDRFISQLDPLYAVALRKYERALKQRNNLLKRDQTTPDELFVWNVALAEHGAYIIEERVRFIERLNASLGDVYRQIAQTNDTVTIHYSYTRIDAIKQKLLGDLHAHSERDRLLGNTSIGPHRHDVLFEFNSSPALSVASRGEVRTIVLALKFLEVDITEQLIAKKPIILLDDVFSELDATRQKLLTSQLSGHQIIITSATSHAGEAVYQIDLT
jgi:DNA replication and repair protein RecF